jgi:hypothetical protein
MVMIATAEAARATRRRGESNGSTYWVTTFLGANRHTLPKDAPVPGEEDIYPMAFLVEQDPGKVVKPHFHQADQFQVVVGGEARMGTHDVTGISVHYTNRYSAYGPIVATEKGVNYFTLRNGWDPGARYMPEQRLVLKENRKEPHREAVAEPEPMVLRPEAAVAVVPEQADGLGAWRYRLAPGETITGRDPASGRGQNWLVVGGGVDVGSGESLGLFTCMFVHPDEAALRVTAGAEGAEVLCMQYPRR